MPTMNKPTDKNQTKNTCYIPCPYCWSDWRLIVPQIDYSGYKWEPCPVCDGTGQVSQQ
ncbi:hypothetical protein WKK05_12585 [Nostoc sp. UHCC 0302]|uniref:hypothetical protein n=1 Tax=Nostoc sp. UHCC 0302 TaxID=3134896 RepID=UPI00311CDBD7